MSNNLTNSDLQQYYPSTFDLNSGKFKFVFNSSDFNYLNGYASLKELLNYANLFKTNVFSKTNYFNGIFVSSINSVSKEVLDFLQNISEDVQDAITFLKAQVSNLNIKTTNMSYDGISTIFLFSSIFEKFACYGNAAFASAVAISNLLKVSKIETTNINTNKINVYDTLTTNKLILANRPVYNYGCFVYVNNSITFMIENEFILPNTLQSNNNLFFTLNKNHQIYIYLNNVLVYYFDNNTNATIYYHNSNIVSFDKIIIYYNYMPIL